MLGTPTQIQLGLQKQTILRNKRVQTHRLQSRLNYKNNIHEHMSAPEQPPKFRPIYTYIYIYLNAMFSCKVHHCK